jgi:predicted nuclease of restriction endonuclease-like (RecB) superfamily
LVCAAIGPPDRDVIFERAKRSKKKTPSKAHPDDPASAQEEIRDPFVLEFLDLKDEYSENDLEQALILHLEHFLLELGNDFTFVARQKRLRVGNEWYRIDLLFFHRRLRALVLSSPLSCDRRYCAQPDPQE